jgi:peptidoglycan L-alanyl-D-glutamate endopeptidase CwlK
MDQITQQRIALLHPAVRDEGFLIQKEIDEALKGKVRCRCAYSLRTNKFQDGLYALGRTVKNPNGYHATKKPMGNIVTWAKGGESYHNYGLAWDIVLLIDRDGNGTYEEASWDTVKDNDLDGSPDWTEVVNIFLKYGWEWGGNWNKPKTDAPHFQKTFGLSIRELQFKMKNNQVIAGTNYVKLNVAI